MEKLGSIWPLWAQVYSRLFYSQMLQEEISNAGIQPGMHVVHIGCGPLPMTAAALARAGAQVSAVDNDPQTLHRAHQYLLHNGLGKQIQLLSACGTDLDYAPFDAVWLSLHVSPLAGIINKAMDTLPQGGRIVYRAPGNTLNHLYPEAQKLQKRFTENSWQKDQCLGKKSVILLKDGNSPSQTTLGPRSRQFKKMLDNQLKI